MSQRKRLSFKAALALAVALVASLAIAQMTTPLPSPPGAAGTTFTIKPTANADGSTTYFIDAASANDMMWIFGQTLQNTQTIQNMKQYAQPVCLVASGADNANNFDWSANKLRNFDGALVSVTAAGVPYRNAVRLGTVSTVQKLCIYGNDIFGRAATGKWYVWKVDTWNALATGAIDTSVLN